MAHGPFPRGRSPGAWALGPTADERAAETAHVRPPPGPQSARSPAGRCRPSDLIRWLPGLLAGSKPASATGRPNPSAISFLLPLLSHEERRRRFRPARGRSAARRRPPPVPSPARALNRVGARRRRADWWWCTGRVPVLLGGRGPARGCATASGGGRFCASRRRADGGRGGKSPPPFGSGS